MTAAQRFNIGLKFLYGTLREPLDRGASDRGVILLTPSYPSYDRRQPAFETGLTDWDVRCISLPSISKQTEIWSGDLQTSQIEFELADTDGGVSATLYASSTSPLGKPVALYMKVSQNPSYWSPLFSGNIVRAIRRKGLISLTVEDSIRNILNSQFVPDYAGIATTIGSVLYGTIKDVVGTNIYVDDKYDIRYITRTVGDGGESFWTKVLGVAIPTLIGAVSGGIGGAMIGVAGGLFGELGQKSSPAYTEQYMRITDYNAISDGIVAGGLNLKFYPGTVSGIASGTSNPLYYVPTFKTRGGHFENGVYGTIEVDDIIHTAGKGGYIYVESELMYWGSPDDIIMNMLVGSNTTVKYKYPDDFAPEWISQSSPLRHIELYSQMSNFDSGGVADAIKSLAQEIGFSFYLDESNRFSVRAVRDVSKVDADIIGTLDESYNVTGDGIEAIEDLQDTYTDLEIKFKDNFSGKLYEQTIHAQFPSATYYGGIKRVKTIQSNWIHDSITGEYITKRMARRYATAAKRIECEMSLYSIPISLGEIVKASGWAIGTNKKVEITGYTKDLSSSKGRVTAEDANSIYSGRSYFYLEGTSGTVDSSARSGFGTILAVHDNSLADSGYLATAVGWAENTLHIRCAPLYLTSVSDLVNKYIALGSVSGEIMKVLSKERVWRDSSGTWCHEFKVLRGEYDTICSTHNFLETVWTIPSPTATCFGIGSNYGQSFRWY